MLCTPTFCRHAHQLRGYSLSIRGKSIVPSELQLPPGDRRVGESSGCRRPDEALQLPVCKEADDRVIWSREGKLAPSVPRERLCQRLVERPDQSRRLASRVFAMNTSCRPFGESANETESNVGMASRSRSVDRELSVFLREGTARRGRRARWPRRGGDGDDLRDRDPIRMATGEQVRRSPRRSRGVRRRCPNRRRL